MSELNEDIALNNGGDEKPAGWKQTNLSNLLTPPQIQQLELILKRYKDDPEDALVAMKEYFTSIGPELQTKGVDPTYLAYVLYAKITGAI